MTKALPSNGQLLTKYFEVIAELFVGGRRLLLFIIDLYTQINNANENKTTLKKITYKIKKEPQKYDRTGKNETGLSLVG